MQQAAEVVMEVRGLAKRFPVGGGPWGERRYVHALDDVSFTLSRGRILALVGESGSGKSTIARILTRLYPPSAGTVLLKGQNALARKGGRATRQYRGAVQMIFQDPFGSLNPANTVAYHLGRPLRIHKGLRGRAREAQILELLRIVGLHPPEEYAGKFPHQLSGGQRQRVAIARALAVDPDVILADEPISMLDVSIRMGILNLLDGLKRDRGISYLYITHDIASARYVADETMVLYAGHVMESAPSEELMQQPLHPYTRLLLSAVPNPAAGLGRRRIQARGEIPTVINPKPGCRFAPRCPLAIDRCRLETPALAEIVPGHLVRCYRAGPDPAQPLRETARS